MQLLNWFKTRKALIEEMNELTNEACYFRSIVKKEFDNVQLVDISVANGLQMSLKSECFAGLLASFLLQGLKSADAKNFVEIAATHPDVGPLTFTIQRVCGETPASKANRLERELAEVKAELDAWHKAAD